MKPAFEVTEHTADLGLKIYGSSFQDLLVHAAQGFYAVTTETQSFPESVSIEITLQAPEPGDLLLKWMREILFYFSAKRYIFSRFEFKPGGMGSVTVTARGFVFDPKTSDQKVEVKAVTYHDFEIKETADGWEASVILDI